MAPTMACTWSARSPGWPSPCGRPTAPSPARAVSTTAAPERSALRCALLGSQRRRRPIPPPDVRTLRMRELRLWAATAAGPVIAAGFYALAALRRRRSLHPTGIGYRGWLQVPIERPARPGVPLFHAGATHQALLRFSRGAGLPEPLPDALGVAIKLPDVHGPGVDQDLLLTSSTDRPLPRRLLLPARSFAHGAFSTALPYDLGSERVVLLLVPTPISAGPSIGVAGHRPVGGALAELRAVAANGLDLELRTAKSLPSPP